MTNKRGRMVCLRENFEIKNGVFLYDLTKKSNAAKQ